MINKYRNVFIALIILAVLWVYALFVPVVYQKEGAVYYLKTGTAKTAVISELSQLGLVRLRLLFSVYAFFGQPIKSGEYLFQTYSTPHSIWRQITTGTGLYYHRFTIVPGKTLQQVRASLKQAEALRPMTATWEDKDIMFALGHQSVSPEGQFFPETYYYTRDTLDLVILKRAYDLMQSRLEEAWQHRAADLPFKDKYQALIAASLVEKEAYLSNERPLIAGVLINRLRKNMMLQFDPTVIYGLGARYDGKIYKKDLLEDTPYNTYKHYGLPPTPIAMPGGASIEAVMHPATHDYLYFVAKGDGSHQFSAALVDHNQAVETAKVVQQQKTS